jgi:hypothetical protein
MYMYVQLLDFIRWKKKDIELQRMISNTLFFIHLLLWRALPYKDTKASATMLWHTLLDLFPMVETL